MLSPVNLVMRFSGILAAKLLLGLRLAIFIKDDLKQAGILISCRIVSSLPSQVLGQR
jgi:hypothetical protein